MLKRCSKCRKKKSLESFYKQNDHKDGLRSHCMKCISEYSREYNLRPEVREYWQKRDSTPNNEQVKEKRRNDIHYRLRSKSEEGTKRT